MHKVLAINNVWCVCGACVRACVCMCVCEREREGEREPARSRAFTDKKNVFNIVIGGSYVS